MGKILISETKKKPKILLEIMRRQDFEAAKFVGRFETEATLILSTMRASTIMIVGMTNYMQVPV